MEIEVFNALLNSSPGVLIGIALVLLAWRSLAIAKILLEARREEREYSSRLVDSNTGVLAETVKLLKNVVDDFLEEKDNRKAIIARLEVRLAELESQLEAKQKELDDLKKSFGTLKSQLEKVEAERDKLKARVTELEKLKEKKPGTPPRAKAATA